MDSDPPIQSPSSRLIGMSGNNSRSIGHLEVLDLALSIFNGEFNGIQDCILLKVVVNFMGSLHVRVP